MFVKDVKVQNQVGLHARPATFFIQKANEFKSSIWVEKEERRVNAKSLLGVLSLGIMGGTKAFGEVAETFHHGRLVKALMENPDFQDLLATRLAELLRGPMSDENMVATIEAMAKIIEQEAVWEEARWGTPVWGWKSSVDQMIRFCQGRSGEMIDSLCRQLHFTQEQREFYFGDLE